MQVAQAIQQQPFQPQVAPNNPPIVYAAQKQPVPAQGTARPRRHYGANQKSSELEDRYICLAYEQEQGMAMVPAPNWGSHKWDFDHLTWPFIEVKRLWLDCDLGAVSGDRDRMNFVGLRKLEYVMQRCFPVSFCVDRYDLNKDANAGSAAAFLQSRNFAACPDVPQWKSPGKSRPTRLVKGVLPEHGRHSFLRLLAKQHLSAAE